MTAIKWAELTERERDALVAEKVMGWTEISEIFVSDYYPDDVNGLSVEGKYTSVPHYTTSIADAWAVVEKLKADDFIIHINVNLNLIQIYRPDVEHEGRLKGAKICVPVAFKYADTLTEAICLAALKVVGCEVVTE